jgi:hypothetical protein
MIAEGRQLSPVRLRRRFCPLLHPIRQEPKGGLLHQLSQLLGRDGRVNVQVSNDVLQQLQHSCHLSLGE